MHIRKDFDLQEIDSVILAVPVGEAQYEFHGVIRLNSTGAFLWKSIQDGMDSREKLIQAMLARYVNLKESVAEADVDRFLETVSVALED